jgi:hypothetical protein
MALSTFSAAELSRLGGFSYSNTASQAVATKLNAIITAIGATPNWGAPVADITALKAVAATDRVSGQSRVCQDNGFPSGGNDSIYVFDAASAATESLPQIVAPAAGTGRWIMAYENTISVASAQAPTTDTVSSAVGAVSQAFATKYTVPAGKLKAGSWLKVAASGDLSANAAVNVQLTLKIGTTVVGVQSAAVSASTAGDGFVLDADLVFSAVGAAGKFNSKYRISVGHDGAGTASNKYVAQSQASLDTTAAQDITILVDFAAGAGATLRLDTLCVQWFG